MNEAQMEQLLAAILIKKGMYAVEAEIVAQRMIDADKISRPDYGCSSIQFAVNSIDVGDIDPRAIVMTKSDTPAVALLNGSEAIGYVSGTKGISLAIEKARAVGIGAVAISNSQHLGSPLVYARMAAQEGMIGCCLTSPPPDPDQDEISDRSHLGRQPSAFAVPDDDVTVGYEFSFGADQPLRHNIPGQLSASLGMLHCLLNSGLTGDKIPPQKTRGPIRERFEHFMLAIDPEHFAGLAHLKQTVCSLLEYVENIGETVSDQAAIKEQAFTPEPATLEMIQTLAADLKVTI